MSEPSKSGNMSMFDLFRNEVKGLVAALEEGVSSLQGGVLSQEDLDTLLVGAHSIRGAARIVRLEPVVRLAGVMEDIFHNASGKSVPWTKGIVESFLKGTALIRPLCNLQEEAARGYLTDKHKEMEEAIADLRLVLSEVQSVEQSADAPISGDESHFPSEIHPVLPSPGTGPQQRFSIDFSMMDLFRVEIEAQIVLLNDGLISLEKTSDEEALKTLMRASHSIKGAARVVGLSPVVDLAHAMEDFFVAAQEGKLTFDSSKADVLLRCVDVLKRLKDVPNEQLEAWLTDQGPFISDLRSAMADFASERAVEETSKAKPARSPSEKKVTVPVSSAAAPDKGSSLGSREGVINEKADDRVVRVTAQALNRLMGLAGESLVESRWLQPFADSLMKLKVSLNQLANVVDSLRESLQQTSLSEKVLHYLSEAQHRTSDARASLAERISGLEMFIRRHASLSDRLYHEVIESRMRPFSDGVEAFPRMVRDFARLLKKKVNLDIVGKETSVDRDILEKLEAPLNHLVRNAVDHGIEVPEERVAAGKKAEGTVRIEARHRAGMLAITVSDDGKGIDIDELRKVVLAKNLVTREISMTLSEAELLEFLFLPGFSTATQVTELSGRGVGLDIVRRMVQDVGGIIRTLTEKGKGTSFHLQLPLTLSVIRALIVEVSGQPYACPLAKIDRVILTSMREVEVVENRQYIRLEGQNIGLVAAHQILELEEPEESVTTLPVIVVSDRTNSYGVAVDRLLGEKEFVVQELESRLGKIPDISAGALLENGDPCLVLDIEDLVASIDNLLHRGRLRRIGKGEGKEEGTHVKRVLVVDDSITVREVECRLLRNAGYDVDSAVDGMDGWNAIRLGSFDLVVTDIDMPRMNGIEFVKQIRSDERLKDLPVVVVSYKDREEDRLAGMEAGANYYLTKGGFHDETLLEAVRDLIGQAVQAR